MPAATIELTSSEWKTFRESAAQDSGAVIPVFGMEPALFSTLDITVTIAGDHVATFTGQVVNVFGSDVALMFDAGALKDIVSAPATGASPIAGTTESERTDSASPSAPTANSSATGHGGEARGEEAPEKGPSRPAKTAGPERHSKDSPVWKRYEGMTRTEKIKLARSGNESERRAVLKDRDSSLHHFVLNNANMKPKELAALIRGGGVSGAFLKKLCERHDFLSNRSVAEALVVNPQTPVDVAIRLVGRIPMEHARRIARSTSYRPQVVNAAKKRVLNR
ncbi:MAG: hypothetical protein ACJAYU_000434 [Bradymonadia bacterium]|jgi:hypothetical protein